VRATAVGALRRLHVLAAAVKLQRWYRIARRRDVASGRR
jgi:hypothetical protein